MTIMTLKVETVCEIIPLDQYHATTCTGYHNLKGSDSTAIQAEQVQDAYNSGGQSRSFQSSGKRVCISIDA